jgi:uncharacterized protein YdeI (YjbR/CyaY-like superfamily)
MDLHAIQPRDAGEWRNWLTQNHNKTNHIWVLFYRKNLKKKGMSYEEAVDEAISFGWIDGKLKKVDADRFALRFSPRKAKSVWSKINKERAERLVKQGRMTAPGFVAIEQAKKTGSWDSAYTNRVRDVLPADLESVLRENAAAWRNFQNFANSYCNQYIGWINAAKTEETRKTRIALVVERSIKNEKPLGVEG